MPLGDLINKLLRGERMNGVKRILGFILKV